jgi:hypothetical protein
MLSDVHPEDAMPPRAHPFCSLVSRHDPSRPVAPFMLRDLAAALYVMGALEEQGFQIGSILLNFPPGRNDPAPQQLEEVDLSRVALGDLIVKAGRLAFDDPSDRPRRSLTPGQTTLEKRLTPEMALQLSPQHRDRASLSFSARRGAFYKGRRFAGKRRTAVFLLRLRALAPGGPGYLGFFGFDGLATLAWAWQLRHMMPELLRSPAFVMAELHAGALPARPTHLDWLETWSVEPLLVHPLDQ